MVVQSSNGHADSTSTTITVHPAPVASFATNNPTANTIDFTDACTGSIAAWSWDFGDLNYSSLQNPTHLYASAGMYYVCLTVTSTDSCSATYCDSVNVIDVGINEHNVVNAIYISPNPAGEMMSVISNSLRDVEEIEITDVVGKRVFSERMETGSRNKLVIDISRLENGIYFLSVRSEELRLSVKFIVSK
jgi:hypothetical protein